MKYVYRKIPSRGLFRSKSQCTFISTLTTNYVKFSHFTILQRTLKSQGYKTK